MRHATLVAAILLLLSACSVSRQTRTVHVSSDGSQAAGVRSAADGVPGEGGPQELVGIYVPFGPFAVKGALLWDGTTFVPPIPLPLAAPAAVHLSAPCAAPQTVDVEETYTVPVTTYETRKRTVKRAVVPIPQAAPAPCAPPLLAPRVDPCPVPAPCPPLACGLGGPCGVPE